MTAGSMAVQLVRREKHQVVEALRKEELRVAQAVMPPLMTQAMANAGAIGDRALAMVRRFSRLHYRMQMFASKEALRSLSGCKGLESECLTATIASKKTPYWLKDVCQVVLHEVSARHKISPDIKTIDEVISGDHGKGFYRMIALILLWEGIVEGNQSHTCTKPVRVPVEIASMRCKKDTTEVLQAILPTIDASLESLATSRVSFPPNSPGKLITSGEPMYEEAIPISLYMAGDLMWVADVLGKTYMGTIWCPYCKINKEPCAVANHAKAQLWSLDRMKAHLEVLEA
jgi:hypothetical protein